nr:hypothetical protein [uncultured Rhodopila sp.]
MPRGGRTSGTRPKGNGAGRGGPARGAQQEPLVPGDSRQGARADNGDAEEQAYRSGRRKRVRELRAFAESAQVDVIQKARAINDLALQSQAADRLLARLPAEAPVQIELSGAAGGPITLRAEDVARMTDAEIDAAIARLGGSHAGTTAQEPGADTD